MTAVYRRPWTERLARNCNGINVDLVKRYERETGKDARIYINSFIAWVGLAATPSAIKKARAEANKAHTL